MFLKKHSQSEWTPADRQRERLLLDYFAAETNLEEKAKAAIVRKGVIDLYPDGPDKDRAIKDFEAAQHSLLCAIGTVDGLRSNWYKCAEKVKTLWAERDAAVSDLRKLVPAWKWDGEKEQSSHKEAPECGCVEFG